MKLNLTVPTFLFLMSTNHVVVKICGLQDRSDSSILYIKLAWVATVAAQNLVKILPV